ncbi:MerR family transcriptional regulator/heat shock protein HspR [Mumia flava]|uniref:MerR family transcriptional regulator/heat shock protein HspR n=1 Tax=Mumia flava TaxID=1348852 RepID=A0A2M9BJ67_9ACTN|nr:helix-turn-helix transcriptional regulator [Mumia flava]PJJ57998.1 MerR family transcriptional regulator/heat shock protein HspR [Mumia flava]
MPRSVGDFTPPGPEAKVFVISIAAELSGLHPQTLRTYDRLGIVSPARTGGGGRRYSLRDIELLREVAQLTAEGLGLEGVRRVLDLENQVLALRSRVAELEAELAAREAEVPPVARNLPVRFADMQGFVVRSTRRR